jgi:hypothetical protein
LARRLKLGRHATEIQQRGQGERTRMPICKRKHREHSRFIPLPTDQGGRGRHVCAGCAYSKGRKAGLKLEESIDMDLDSLDGSQAQNVRHVSPHAAWALGYLAGVRKYYRTHPSTRGRRHP